MAYVTGHAGRFLQAQRETDPIPDGTYFVRIGGSFDDCHDCAYGKKARLCPDQDDVPGIDNAPEIWVRSRDVPSDTVGFLWGNFCYELRASDGEQVIPIDAFILNPRSDFGGCTECKLGVQAQRCPTEPDPAPGNDYEVWVEASEAEALQDVGVVYFRYRELCYSLDPSTTPSRTPFEAKRVIPKDEYLDCETCICGERSVAGDMGVKAHLCLDQSVNLAEDVWILEEDIPLEPTSSSEAVTAVAKAREPATTSTRPTRRGRFRSARSSPASRTPTRTASPARPVAADRPRDLGAESTRRCRPRPGGPRCRRRTYTS